jgi:transcription elongation GreA/GreB family factor
VAISNSNRLATTKNGGRRGTMSVTINQVWLTQDAHDLLKSELAALMALRGDDAAEEADVTELEQREIRIRPLLELIRSAVVHQPPDDGVAEPGMVLTVRYESEGETETFLMADREEATNGALEVCSPRSPLAEALIGAVPGDKREYRAPDGTLVTVALIRAVPFGVAHE